MQDILTQFDPLPKKFINGLLILLLILTALLRLYNLTKVPPALYQDETSIGYNAYLIAETGKDEYNKAFPLYFRSFGDYKLPMYIYTVALFTKILGVNELAVRLPSAFAGIISVFLLFYLVRHLTKNSSMALISAFFLAFNPQHILFSRAAFEVNMALMFALAGVLCFILAADTKRFWLLGLSVLAFGASLYSYNVTRLLSPILALLLILIYWKKIKIIDRKYQSGLVVLALIVIAPFMVTFLSPSGAASAQGTLITSQDILAKDLEFRSYLAHVPQIYVKLFFNKFAYMIFQYFQNLISVLSGSFFFVSGTSHGNQGIGTVGMFYVFDAVFFVMGLYVYFVHKIKSLSLFLYWLVTVWLILSLSKEVPHATRGYFFIIPVVVFSAFGFLMILKYLLSRPNLIKRISLAALLLVMFFDIQYYLLSYYFQFPATYAQPWRVADKQLTEYLKDKGQMYDKIIIDDQSPFMYSSLLFYSKYSPQEFLQTVHRDEHKKGLVNITSFGKYEFRTIDWGKDSKLPNTLLVSTPTAKPDYLPIEKEIDNPTRYIVQSVDENIMQFPVTDREYVVVDTNKIKQ